MVSGISSTSSYILQMLQQTMQQRQDDLFSKVDTSGDSKIDKTEFSDLAKKLSEAIGSSTNTDEVFSKYDANNDGSLSKDELDNFMKENAPPPPQNDMGGIMSQMSAQGMQQMLGDLFSKLDSSDNGSIDKSEFSTFASKMSKQSGMSLDVDNVFSKYDANNDSALSKDELDNFMKENAPPPPMQNALSAYGTNSSSDQISELIELLKKLTTNSTSEKITT